MNQEMSPVLSKVFELYTSRNQVPVKGLYTVWHNALKGFDDKNVIIAIDWYIKNGDDFPSLPKIIKIVTGKRSPEIESLEAWISVKKAVKERRGSLMTLNAKKVYDMICDNGITDYIEADDFKRGQIERDFKKIYKSYADGSIKPQLEHDARKKQVSSNDTVKALYDTFTDK